MTAEELELVEQWCQSVEERRFAYDSADKAIVGHVRSLLKRERLAGVLEAVVTETTVDLFRSSVDGRMLLTLTGGIIVLTDEQAEAIYRLG